MHAHMLIMNPLQLFRNKHAQKNIDLMSSNQELGARACTDRVVRNEPVVSTVWHALKVIN